MTGETPQRPVARYALLVALGAAGTAALLLGLFAASQAGSGATAAELVLAPRLALVIGLSAAILAAGEERAARLIQAGRRLPSLGVLGAAALAATAVGAANTAWALAVAEGSPDQAPGRTLELLLLLAPRRVDDLLLLGFLPVGLSAVRATRWLVPAGRLFILAIVLGGFWALVTSTGRRGAEAFHVEAAAVLAGCSYLAGGALADVLLPAPPPRPPRLSEHLAPLALLLCLAAALARLPGAAAWLALLPGLLQLGAWLRKRQLVARFDGWSCATEPAPPPGVDRQAFAPLEAELARHGLRLVAFRRPNPLVPLVQGLAEGPGPAVAIANLELRGGAPVHSGTTLLTILSADRLVMTTSQPFTGLQWHLRSPWLVHDCRPGATLDERLARHAADVAAVSALTGPPTGPGDVRRFVEAETAGLPALRQRIRLIPALPLLLSLLRFHAPRPVRLRGPLPA